MRICVLSGYFGMLDEGWRNVAVNLSDELAKSNEVLHITNPRRIFTWKFWNELREFQPHIIHIFLAHRLKTFLMAQLLNHYCAGSQIVMSGLQFPFDHGYIKLFAPLLKPDLMLIQSKETRTVFEDMGFQTVFLSNGVNTRKFAPVSYDKKMYLREKYDIDSKGFVVLHVGHILKRRNIQKLKDIQKLHGCQLIIVGSPAFKHEHRLSNELEQSGITIWKRYFDQIEEIYQLADCYVFPTIYSSRCCIDVPLSVLEAMACNLPVITTRFGGLPDLFEQKDGLIFNEIDVSFVHAVENFMDKHVSVRTRDMVIDYTWEDISTRLMQIYTELLID